MHNKTRSTTAVRLTFRQILEDSRSAAADELWNRAALFSRLRHLARAKHRVETARRCGEYKARLLGRLIRLAPDLVKVVPASDSDRLFSVRFRQRGQLHLPPRYVAWS